MPGRNAISVVGCCLGLVCLAAMSAMGCSGGGDGAQKCKSGLMAGDLVITEIMANPEGRDEGKEWIEIFNPGGAMVDLTGVLLEAARADGSGAESHVIIGAQIDAGDYLVLGGMLEEVKPDYVDYAYGADLGGLRNAGGQIELTCDDALIDRVVYFEMGDGIAHQFDGNQDPDSIANDDTDAWCEAQLEYEADSLGTPGDANTTCDTDIPPTSCKENGEVRDVVAPVAGDLVITEFMPNPDSVDDGVGEWFEVYVGRDLDLNGLQLGKTTEEWEEQVNSLECAPVTAGTYLLFARSAEATENGGLPAPDRVFDFTLANTSGGVALGYGGEVLDAITYSSSHTGASTALEPTLTDPVENDNEDYWCEGANAYGDGDLGTPGAANPSCGISPEGKCYDEGVLRDQVKPVAGDLVITEIMADPDNPIGDDVGEWLEIYVGADVDLNQLQVGKADGEVEFSLPGGDCITVTAGTYVVLAASTDPQENGGLPEEALLLDMGLTNGGSDLFVGIDDVVLDSVTYGSASSGKSTSLDSGSLDTTANDNLDNWCDGVDEYHEGNLGTPGGANPSCQ